MTPVCTNKFEEGALRLKTIILLLIHWQMLITMPVFAGSSDIFIISSLPDTVISHTDTLDQSLEKQIKYNARDSIRYEAEGQKIILFGEAQVDYSGTSLTAGYIEIDNKKNTITAQGLPDSTGKMTELPVFKDAENEMRCDKIIYNTKTKKGKIYGVLTKQADLLVYGEVIKKDTNNVMYIKNAKCIPCEFEDANFYFRATKAKVIPDDKIVTGPIFVEVATIKTPLGLPFGFFPNVKNKSKAGVIIPYLGASPGQGFFMQNGGVYFPVNEKMDMQLTGDIYSSGSWAIRTTNNYRIRYKYSGSLGLEFKEIRTGEKEIPYTENAALGVQKFRNFSIQWSHQQDGKSRPNDHFGASVNIQSGLNSKYNAISSAQYLTNTFYSNVNYNHSFVSSPLAFMRNSNLSLNARHNQNTQTRQMEITLPELTYVFNRVFPFKNEGHTHQNWLDKLGVSYLLESRSNLKGADTIIFKPGSLDSVQYGIRHNIPISTNFNLLKYFTLTPQVNFISVMYGKTIERKYVADSGQVYTNNVQGFKTGVDANFSANLSTKIFGDYFFKTKRLKQIRHFIIPTAGFSYHPDMTKYGTGGFKTYIDSLGQENYYSIFERSIYGGSTAAESGMLSMNLSNNLEAKVRQKTDSGFVYRKMALIQNLSMSGSYNLAAADYKWSMLSVTGRNRVWKNIDLLVGASFDPYALDSTGKRSKKLLYENGTQLARFTTGSLAANAGFNPQLFRKENTGQANSGSWSLNMSYNLTYRVAEGHMPESITQALNFNGNAEITKKWKLNFNSGFDFKTKNLSYTYFSLYRDLRCWEAHIDWVPFGFNKRYSVTISLKSPSLSSVRIPRSRAWYDNL